MFGFVQPRTHDQLRIHRSLLNKLQLFQRNPELLSAGMYVIKSDVDPDVFDLFFERVGGDTAAVVTSENAEQLQELCDELEFSGFDEEIRSVLGSNWKTRKDVAGMRGRVDRHDVVLEELQRRVLELERQFREHQKVPEMVEAVARRLEEIQCNDVRAEVERLGSELIGRASAENLRVIDQRVKETEMALRDEILRLDVTGRVSEVASAVAELRSEMSSRASAEAVKALSGEVTRLKQDEQRIAAQLQEIAPNEFVYNKAAPLKGIIAHLTRKCGGNVHEKGLVEVTASSIFDNSHRYVPEHAVELGSESEFCSELIEGSWLCYDFKGRRVTPTSYTIRSHKDPHRPKSWDLEVSNDGRSWEPVDRRRNNSNLKGDGFVTYNFSIDPVPGGRFRFVRLRMMGKDHKGSDNLSLTALEVFGSLSL